MKDSFDYQILNLTKDFYLSYPSPPYTELISKEQRPYNCLLIQSHYDYFICIPYRSKTPVSYQMRMQLLIPMDMPKQENTCQFKCQATDCVGI